MYTFCLPYLRYAISHIINTLLAKLNSFNNDFLFLQKIFYNCNNYKTSIAPISSKRIELSGALSTGARQMQSSSTMIRWNGNLGRISESERVSFQKVTERNYAIWWLSMFREWIPKSRDSNWNSPSMGFNSGNKQVKTRWTELSGLGC